MTELPPMLKCFGVPIAVLALVGGVFTPAACLACVLLQFSTIQSESRLAAWPLIVPLALPIVLLFLGPGAYSIDAKRYGRRVISGQKR